MNLRLAFKVLNAKTLKEKKVCFGEGGLQPPDILMDFLLLLLVFHSHLRCPIVVVTHLDFLFRFLSQLRLIESCAVLSLFFQVSLSDVHPFLLRLLLLIAFCGFLSIGKIEKREFSQ